MLFVLVILANVQLYLAADRLESYNVDKSAISVSGLSAGAAFANNFHVAHSASIMGMASFAGMPYWCPQNGGLPSALTPCMYSPQLIFVSSLIAETDSQAASGGVDPTDNLNGAKVFIFHGTSDYTVFPAASDKIETYYENYNADIEYVTMDAGHGQPTVDYGVTCIASAAPYINRCDYDGAFQGLNHIYGGDLVEPSGDVQLNGKFYSYDQSEFGSSNSFDNDGGFIYVPSGCVNPEKRDECSMDPDEREDCGFGGISPEECEAEGCCFDSSTPNVPWCFNPDSAGGNACKLHVAFHGCSQGRQFEDEEYSRNSGYLEVGELNNIIMLFPQIRSSLISNPNGCFDWWSYDGNDYATKAGKQIQTVKAMIDRVTGDDRK